MKIRHLYQLFIAGHTYTQINPFNDVKNVPSFTHIEESDDETAKNYTRTVRNSAVNIISTLMGDMLLDDDRFYFSCSGNLLVDKAEALNQKTTVKAIGNAIMDEDHSFLAKGMNHYLHNILDALNRIDISLIPTDRPLTENADRFIKYIFICEQYQSIIDECGNDENVTEKLDAIRNHPVMKFIEARMNIIANPLYAKYYNNGAIYNASDEYFETPQNSEEGKYLAELIENLTVVRELTEQKKAEVERTEPAIKAVRLLREMLEAEGYTTEQISQLRFYDVNGKKFTGINGISRNLSSKNPQPYFFAAIPGYPLRKFDNNISWKLTPDSDLRYGTIKPVSGDPYENLFRSGMAKLSASAKAAHISKGSSQYAEMEKLFNEYNALVGKPGFDQSRASELLTKLDAAAKAYLSFKEAQRGNDNGMIRGKNSREQRRIDFASSVIEFAQNKFEFTNNIQALNMANNQYISFENPAATFSQNGINLNIAKGANTTERDHALGKYLSDTVYNQLKPFFDQFKNSSVNPLDFIIIDGKSVSGITAATNNEEISAEAMMQNACEVIACALLANRPVTIHAANGTLSHLNEPVKLNLAPNGFKLQPPIPAPDYFMRRFTELGFDRTNYFTSEMSADNLKNAMTSMELLKNKHISESYEGFAARKDFVDDWLAENKMDNRDLGGMSPFSLGREASVTIPRIVALGRGMSVEDVMTLGAKHDEKKAISKEFLDICKEWSEKEKNIDPHNDEQTKEFNRQRSDAFKNIADDTYKGYLNGMAHLSRNLIKLDIGNIESISNPQNAQLVELAFTLFDVSQELTGMNPYFSEMALKNDPNATTADEALINMNSKLLCMTDYLTSYKNSVNTINELFSGSPEVNSRLDTNIPHILAFTIQSEMIKSAKAQKPDANFTELFDDPFALSPIYAHACAEMSNYSNHRKLPEISRLIAELAVDGKLKDYVTYDAQAAKISLDMQGLEKIVNAREASQNKAIENNRNSRKPELNESVAEITPSNPQPKNGSIVLGA